MNRDKLRKALYKFWDPKIRKQPSDENEKDTSEMISEIKKHQKVLINSHKISGLMDLRDSGKEDMK